ncbi:MAG: cobalamin B12-binding domain-containing protein [Chloroflexi bacterium]|nr:cobalamin B12-binding domain-containing protein [Chloroflexota bacterium]
MSKPHKIQVALVHPGSRTQVYQSLGRELAAIEPPVWAGLMATYLRKKGYSVAVVDADAEDLTPQQTAQRITELDPLLTAVVVYGQQPSASTQTMPSAGAMCRAIKEREPGRQVILVGGHVAALPERALLEEAADFVCGGEGPITLAELVELLGSSQPDEYHKVRGLWYWEDGKIRATQAAPLVRDLDSEMPGMAWDLLPMERYRAHNWHCFGDLKRQPYASLYTTLGCPFRCSFCCIQAPFKSGEEALGFKQEVNTYRFWSPKLVIEQLDVLVNQYGVRNIKFADEMFVLNTRHIGGICDLIIERGYDLNIWAYARVDTVKDDMADKLKRAGFTWLAFGLESGSERVRSQVDKRFEEEDIYRTLEKVRAAGINVGANYIFGLPEDDLQSMQETLDMALDLNCEWANFYSAMAYPGSRLYEEAIRNSWQLPATWSGYSQHAVDTLPLPTNHISAGEVLRFRDQAFNSYFSSPRYQEMIGRKFGPETVAHVQEMLSHRLERQHA